MKLTVHRNRREALAVLEHAFSLGITHFDVARAYGFGRAEGILRDFLGQKRAAVTQTTKFGITPPAGLAGNVRLINGLKKVLGPFPGLLRNAKNRGSSMVKANAFTPAAAIQSLETSLRELGTDYVDCFLLHEGTVADASSENLIEALLREVEKGKIRRIGLGSAPESFRRPYRAYLLSRIVLCSCRKSFPILTVFRFPVLVFRRGHSAPLRYFHV